MTDTESDTAAKINVETNFIWPDAPPEDWWLTQGAALGLDDGQIKFSAALFQLGGADAKKNSAAGKLAGMPWDRVQAFRQARSVAVRKLLTEANGIKRGKREPVTEAEVDDAVDRLIRAPDALTVARGIELREKRRGNARRGDFLADFRETARDRPDLLYAHSLREYGPKRGPVIVSLIGWYRSTGSRGTDHFWLAPLLEKLAPHVAQDFPEIWKWLCEDWPTNDHERQWFPKLASEPRQPVEQIINEILERYRDEDARTENVA